MKTDSIATIEAPKPLDIGSYKPSTWEQVIFVTVVGPIVLLCANKVWERIEARGKRTDKKQDSELKSFETLFSEFQKQYNLLLQEIIHGNDEALKNIQATLSTTVGVLATVADNQKAYAEIAMRRSEETRQILDKIQTASERTVIESINSHIRINQMSVMNQQKILAELQEIKKIEVKIHERLDKYFGSDRID